MGNSPGDLGDVPVMQVKRRQKNWGMSCDVGEATEGLANEALLIPQPFRCSFTYVTGTSPTSPGELPMDGRYSTDTNICILTGFCSDWEIKNHVPKHYSFKSYQQVNV